MKNNHIIKSFTYPVIKDSDKNFEKKFGDNGISGSIINETGDWTKYLAPNELQSQNGVESSACFVEANQKTIGILKEYQYGIKDENYSARFNALLSDGTEVGGDPLKGAYSIKKDGLIPQSMMDWKDIETWGDYHSWKGTDKDKCISKGQQEAREWDKKYYILFEKDDPIEVKYNNIRQALKRSPVPISVYAWLEKDGAYYKPNGADDTHLTTAIVVDIKDNCLIVQDTYEPFIKKLAPNTNPDFGMYWIIRNKSPEEVLKDAQKNFIILLLEYVAYLFKKIGNVAGEIIGAVFQKRN